MIGFFLRRLLLVVPTFFGITLIAFSLIHLLPGDPIQIMIGERAMDPEFYRIAKERLGLDQPLYTQYFTYLVRLAHGNLGTSFVTDVPVIEEFRHLFPATLELSACAMLFGAVLGLTMGVCAALKRGTIVDQGIMGVALTGYSMPIYWWGLLLIMFFSVYVRTIAPEWALPVSGRIALEYDVTPVTGFMLIDTLLNGEAGSFTSALKSLILPSIVLGTIPLAVIARMTRSSLLEVLKEDYVRTARAKGLGRPRVVIVHALRNALIPVVTVIGLQVGQLLAGAVLTETIFSWPGVGKWLIDAIGRRDYPVVQGGILIVATLIIFVNLSVDLLYGIINPRIRSRH